MNSEDFPPLDFVLLSHLHEDHFDQLVNERLQRTIRITTTPKAAYGLKRGGFQRSIGLETWDDMTFIKRALVYRSLESFHQASFR
jgi:L-ascorbate metabolism protein UlaG (beta-lactamase superfamily)